LGKSSHAEEIVPDYMVREAARCCIFKRAKASCRKTPLAEKGLRQRQGSKDSALGSAGNEQQAGFDECDWVAQ